MKIPKRFTVTSECNSLTFQINPTPQRPHSAIFQSLSSFNLESSVTTIINKSHKEYPIAFDLITKNNAPC